MIGLVLLAVAVRLGLSVATKSWTFSSAENFRSFGYEMGQIAYSLATGDGFSYPGTSGKPTAWMAPLYPFLIAGVFQGFGIFTEQSAKLLELFQIIASAASCVLLYLIGRRLYGAPAGLLAGLLMAVYPSSMHFAAQKIWSTSLFTFALLLILLMFLRLRERPRLRGGVALGVVLGLTVLLDPVILGVLPFAAAWLVARAEPGRTRIHKVVIAMAVALCATLSPWLVRNTLAFGELVFIKSNFGHELYLGNNERSDGTYSDALNDELEGGVRTPLLTESEREYVKGADEAGLNRLYFRKAIAFIGGNPLRFATLSATRIVRFWTFGGPLQSWQEKAAAMAYFAVLVLAAVGLWWSRTARFDRRRRRDLQLLALALLSFPLPYYLTIVGLLHYRFPVEPILMIFAGYALSRLVLPARERAPGRSRHWVAETATGRRPLRPSD